MTEQTAVRVLAKSYGEKHIHREPEILYILAGRARIEVGKESYMAEKGDVLAVNPDCPHCVRMPEGSLVLCVKLDAFFLKRIYRDRSVRFSCNSTTFKELDYGRICYLLEQIAGCYAGEGRELLCLSLYYALWQNLCDKFLEAEKQEETDEKIFGILREVREKYGTSLSLSEMAAKWYMSESAFSRYFKKKTGVNFGEYVLNVRLEHAGEQLLFTGKSMTEIAYDCGFSNSSVFNKNFKKKYGMTPGEYRVSENGGGRTAGDADSRERLRKYLKEDMKPESLKEHQNSYLFYADRGIPFSDNALVCINAGQASGLLEGRMQEQVAWAVKRLRVRYVRILDPFEKRMEIRMDGVCPEPNFDRLDRVLDFLTGMRVLPVIEFPENPKRIVARMGSKVNKTEERKGIFSSLEEWLGFLEIFLEHLVERYTAQEVNSWCIELWDMPGLELFSSVPYMRFYEETFLLIRKYLSNVRIGACGLNAEISRKTLTEYLKYWMESEMKPDYLSTFYYPYSVDYYGKGNKLLKLETDSRFMKEKVENYKRVLRETGYPDTPVWINEWNTTVSDRNIYNDTCAKACHMLTQMTDMVGEVQVLSYGNISDGRALYYDVRKPFVGAAGLISKDGVPKPAYYAMEFWSILAGCSRLVGKGEHFILNAREDGVLALLAFHPQKFSHGYYMKEEDEWKPQDIPFLFEESEELKLRFLIRGLKNGKKRISRYSIYEDEGSVLAEWKKLGYEELNQKELDYLRKRCIPQLRMERISVTEHELDLKVALKPNEVSLLLIR